MTSTSFASALFLSVGVVLSAVAPASAGIIVVGQSYAGAYGAPASTYVAPVKTYAQPAYNGYGSYGGKVSLNPQPLPPRYRYR